MWDNHRGRNHQVNTIEASIGEKLDKMQNEMQGELKDLRTEMVSNLETMKTLLAGTSYNTMKALDGAPMKA